MAIEYPDLSELDETLVNETFDLIAESIAEFDPTIDTKFGVFQNIVVYINALLSAAIQTELTEAKNSLNLKALQDDTTLAADDELVDSVAANFRIDRKDGVKATGNITVVISSDTLLTIPSGTIWTALGLNFVTNAGYIVRPVGSTAQTSNDRILKSVGTNRWAFTISVTAESEGANYNIDADTRLTTTLTVPTFVVAYAESNFTGGVTKETNSDLAGRVLTGMALKAWSNRTSIEAMIKAQSAYSNVTNVSIVGFGDAEMLRDQHTLWPGSMGGRADLYIRTQKQLAAITLDKTATLIAKTGTQGTWRFSIGKDDAPGFYEVRKIVPADNTEVAGFTPSLDTRATDLTGTGYIPDIDTAIEGAYSPYQTSTIEFVDTVTNATSLTVNTSTKSYKVTLTYMPTLKSIQDFIGGRDVRAPAGDALVKAPVPCFVSASITVNKLSAETSPSTSAIQLKVAEVVNGVGFTGRIPTTTIASGIASLLTATMTVSDITLTGRLRYPDGTLVNFSSNQVLTVTDDPTDMVSAKTVQFYLDPEDVSVTVNNLSA